MASKKHEKIIRAWLDGAPIQYLLRSMNRWVDTEKPNFEESEEFRIKPTEPERVYPVTRMTHEEMWSAYEKNHRLRGTWNLAIVANAALRHAIDAGQVVTREEFDRATAWCVPTIEQRKARDMAVAKHIINTFMFTDRDVGTDERLAAIIAEVKS